MSNSCVGFRARWGDPGKGRGGRSPWRAGSGRCHWVRSEGPASLCVERSASGYIFRHRSDIWRRKPLCPSRHASQNGHYRDAARANAPVAHSLRRDRQPLSSVPIRRADPRDDLGQPFRHGAPEDLGVHRSVAGVCGDVPSGDDPATLFERDDAKELTEPFIALEQRSEPEDRDRRPVVGVGSRGELGASLGDDVVDPAFDARELLVENVLRGPRVGGWWSRASPHRPAVRCGRLLLLRRGHSGTAERRMSGWTSSSSTTTSTGNPRSSVASATKTANPNGSALWSNVTRRSMSEPWRSVP